MSCCGKQEVNFAILPLVLKVDQRDAVAFLLDGHDILAVLPKFDFPSLCNCGRNGTRETSNCFGCLSPEENHQWPDFRGQKYGLFSFISCWFILEGVEKLSITLCFSEKVREERLLNFEKDNCSAIHENLAAVVINSCYFDDDNNNNTYNSN